jgi:acetolactate decarboxylase
VTTELNLEGIQAFIDQAFPEKNSFLAIRIQGSFKKVRTRSVPAQVKPYPPLTEVTRNQPEFEKENVSGALLGFRCPPYVKAINIPGYHLHFLSTDHQFGGHVLQVVIEHGQIELDPCYRFNMILPETDQSFQNLDLTRDRSQDLKEVEQE